MTRSIRSVRITDSTEKPGKRAKAVFTFDDGKGLTRYFGAAGSNGTYYDGAPRSKRDAYLARHRVNEDWSDVTSPGFLSRYVLWESADKVLDIIKQKTKTDDVKIKLKKIKVVERPGSKKKS